MSRTFIPFTKDVPLDYAYERPEFYRNAAREKAWGVPVYFSPCYKTTDEYGVSGPYYVFGKPCKKGQGKKGNCMWFFISRAREMAGVDLDYCRGSAVNVFAKYKGRKDGGKEHWDEYIGDTLQAGDWIIYADNKNLEGDGHIHECEIINVQSDKVTIAESAYSDNALYTDKTCIVFDIKLSDLVVGKKIKLRPNSPYYELVYGIIHVGDYYNQWEAPTPVVPTSPVNEENDLAKINVLAKQIVSLTER